MSIYRVICTKDSHSVLRPEKWDDFLEVRRWVKKHCPHTGRIYLESWLQMFIHGEEYFR